MRITDLSCASIPCEEHVLAVLDELKHFPLQVGPQGKYAWFYSFQILWYLLIWQGTSDVAHLLRSKLWTAGFINTLQGGWCLHASLDCRPFFAQRVRNMRDLAEAAQSAPLVRVTGRHWGAQGSCLIVPACKVESACGYTSMGMAMATGLIYTTHPRCEASSSRGRLGSRPCSSKVTVHDDAGPAGGPEPEVYNDMIFS